MEVLEKAYVNSPYGNRNGSFHTGVDVLSGCNNRKVYSPAKGKVIYVVNNFPDSEVFTEPHSGNEIRIEHGKGYITRYSHLKYNTITVNVGDIVEEGTVIAEEGMSGYATGVHLDFELWKDGNYKYVDPTDVALGKVRLPDYIVSSSKSVEELANEVIKGLWGNGVDRKNRLTNAGYDYNVIQNRVNEILNNSTSQLKSLDEIAKEVIRGNWGNGVDRKNRLTEAGYDYNTVQNRVNEMMK